MRLIVNIESVPPVLKATMQRSVKYDYYIVDIPDELFPTEVKDAVYNPTDDKFIIQTYLTKDED